MSSKTFSLVSGAFFLIVGVLHGARIMYGWEAVLGGVIIPLWASWVALAIALSLAYQGLKLGWA